MTPATTTACTRTSTASTCFRCRLRSCCRSRARDFEGGEFVLTEQRPRMQSRAEVVPLGQGDGSRSLRCIIARCRERAASTASICAMA